MEIQVDTANLKGISDAAGAWLFVPGDGDYHVYVSCEGVVLGHNPQEMLNGKSDYQWSDPAISINNGKIEVQYGDCDHKCVTHEVPAHKFIALYKKFLADVVEASK